MSESIAADDVRVTRDAYDAVAERYAELVTGALEASSWDRAVLAVFAERVCGLGTVADLGCGPGRITGYLDSLGVAVYGLDLSAEMVRLARAAHPGLRFEQGSMERLALPGASLAGIVAWYSLIHTPPERMGSVLSEFARVLVPGGQLLLGFQTAAGPQPWQAYDHAVAPAYRWSPDGLAQVLASVGMQTTARVVREPELDERTGHGYLLARQSAASHG
jgi:SAM-dependent methyltransferase